MCGIAAVLLTPEARSAETWAAIRENFTQNLLFNEKRGAAATGVAVAQADGRVQVWKRPCSAHVLVADPAYKELLATVGAETTLLMGHTRHPTKGTPQKAGNNHPIQTGPITGVHNGRIHNDDALFRRYRYRRQAEVDSEIIFHLLAPVAPLAAPDIYISRVRPLLSQLEGKYTILAHDARAPEQLLVLKHHNPLSVHYHAGWQGLVFSSRYVFLRKTFGAQVIGESLLPDQVMLFSSATLAQYRHQPLTAVPLQGNSE